MFNIFGNLWKRKEVEPIRPRVSFEPTGNQLLYKMKYVGNDEKEYRQRNLILFRVSIKRITHEIQIAKQERRHHQRAKQKLFDGAPAGDIHSLAIDQRCRFLAYGYIRQKTYAEVEGTAVKNEHGQIISRQKNARWRKQKPDRPEPQWDRVADLIFRYGNYNEFLLSPDELKTAKKEQLDHLRKWAGN